MAKKIRWSVNSIVYYKAVIDYLIENWGAQTAEKFIESVEQKLFLLSEFPFLGRLSPKGHPSRQLIISKHNKLIYEIKGDTIFVTEIFDTRQRIT